MLNRQWNSERHGHGTVRGRTGSASTRRAVPRPYAPDGRTTANAQLRPKTINQWSPECSKAGAAPERCAFSGARRPLQLSKRCANVEAI